jgi:hypothetical protein
MDNAAQHDAALAAVVAQHDSFFTKTGPLPTKFDEVRRFPRFYYRTCAEITVYPVDPFVQEPEAKAVVLTSDLSRGGVSVLHNAPLVQGQRVEIALNGQPPRPMEVMWSHLLADGRYGIGCRFVAANPPAAPNVRA